MASGCLPCNSVIVHHMAKDGNKMIVGLKDIGLHYATTICHYDFSSPQTLLREQYMALAMQAATPMRPEASVVNFSVKGNS